jgi:hypothetical protein
MDVIQDRGQAGAFVFGVGFSVRYILGDLGVGADFVFVALNPFGRDTFNDVFVQ